MKAVFLGVLALSVLAAASVGPSSNPKPVAAYYFNAIQSEVNLMRTRWQSLDAQCSPNAVFALTYLYMTNGFLTKLNANYFDDGEFLANFTLNFASRYSQAIDSSLANNPAGISLPWKEAFNYAASGYSSVSEDLTLGMNAHINYDLSNTVYDMKYGYPQYKTDYDRINDLLEEMQPLVTNDIGSRYDASLLAPGAEVLNGVILTLIKGWREGAWANGVLQLHALTSLGRAALKASVLVEALTFAQTQKTWNGGMSTTAARVAYCQANHAPSRI